MRGVGFATLTNTVTQKMPWPEHGAVIHREVEFFLGTSPVSGTKTVIARIAMMCTHCDEGVVIMATAFPSDKLLGRLEAGEYVLLDRLAKSLLSQIRSSYWEHRNSGEWMPA